jgi:hypothetical protein
VKAKAACKNAGGDGDNVYGGVAVIMNTIIVLEVCMRRLGYAVRETQTTDEAVC